MNFIKENISIELLCDSDIVKAVNDALNLTDFKRVRITSLYIENAELLNDEKLFSVLLGLVKKGITVTILIGQKLKRNHWVRFFEELDSFGIKLYYNRRVHSKMILLDSPNKRVALILSANLTHGGLHYRYESGVYLKYLDDNKYKK